MLRSGFFSLRRFGRFYLEFKLRGYVVVQLDCDFVFARVLDRPLQYDFVAIDLLAKLVLEPSHDVLRGDRSERLTRLARGEGEGHSQLADTTRELLRFIQLARLTFSPFL